MPIYEYECAKCGRTFEVIQKMSDKPLRKHEGCGGALTKLISASGFQFKGTGWYVTDYSKKNQPPAKETKEASSNGSSEKSEKSGKSDKSEKHTTSKSESSGGAGKKEKGSKKE